MAMTDENYQADSGRNEYDKRNAEILDTSGPRNDPDVYLVRYPNGEVEYEPATTKNRILFEDGLFDQINGYSDFAEYGIQLQADVSTDSYAIEASDVSGGVPVEIPSSMTEDVVRAFTSDYDTGQELLDLYYEMIEGQVRRNIVDSFADYWPSDRVEITSDGWVVDDTFLVKWDGTNQLLGLDPTDPKGSEYDDSKQAVYLDLNPTGSRTETAPNGTEYELTETEQAFLTTVEILLFPEDHVGVELVDEIEQARAEGSMENLFSDLASGSQVTGFTDSKTGIHHGSTGHSFQKHDIRDLNVTEEVRDLLWSHGYDHAGVVELNMRRQELINRPDVNIFTDAEDDDASKWNKIERTVEKAPIPPRVRSTLEDMYGG